MKRLGWCSLRLYEEDERHNMHECGVCVTNAQAEDTVYMEKLKNHFHSRCAGCSLCRESMKVRGVQNGI